VNSCLVIWVILHASFCKRNYNLPCSLHRNYAYAICQPKSIATLMNVVKRTLHIAVEVNKNENMTSESNFDIELPK
jgi:hypothetical protein